MGSYIEGSDFTITTNAPPPKIYNVPVEPSYKAEDWVSIYDGEGHTITVEVTLLEGTKKENYVFIYDPGMLEVIQRDEEFEKLPEKTKDAIKEADRKVNEILEELTEEDQEKSGERFVKYQLTITKKNDLTEKDRTVPDVADVDAAEQVKEIVKKTGKTPDRSEYIDVILAVMFPYEVPDGMELLGVSRSCHPDNDYDPANATHGLLTAVPKVPEGQKPTQEGFYYDPEKGTVTLYAKDFCLFGFHLKKKTTPSPCPCVTPPCSESSNPCTVECPYGYQIKVALSD